MKSDYDVLEVCQLYGSYKWRSVANPASHWVEWALKVLEDQSIEYVEYRVNGHISRFIRRKDIEKYVN